jgi:N4-gp56 family major capsid protein
MADTFNAFNTVGDLVAVPAFEREVYDMDIMWTAEKVMQWKNLTTIKTDLLATPGQRIVFTKMRDITGGGPLLEKDDINITSISADQTSIEVTEWANAVGFTEKAANLHNIDYMREMAKGLGRNYAKVLEYSLRDTAYLGTTMVYPNGIGSRAALRSGVDVFDTRLLSDVYEILQTQNAPKFAGRGTEAPFYVCVCHPHQIVDLSNDARWRAVDLYSSRAGLGIINAEAGRWMDIVFISTSACRNGAAGAGDGVYTAALDNAAVGGAAAADVYKATFLGDYALAHAVARNPEMRYAQVDDWGRKHALAWYTIMGNGILNDEHIVNAETV